MINGDPRLPELDGVVANCGKCVDELPEGETPRTYARTQLILSPEGLQVWCNRHNCNVVTMDVEGAKEIIDNPPPCECGDDVH